MAVATLDDLAVAGSSIGLRVDINSPVADDGSLRDDARLRAHVDTIDELADRGGRVVVLAHQGRPGGDQFTTLAAHADRLAALLGRDVGYVDETFSGGARTAIRGLDDGEVLCLENVRFYSEEYMEFEPRRAASTHLVDRLAPTLDAFVNDAFAVSHRSQPSVVGFPEVVPSYAGRVMERELEVLGDIGATPTPRVALLGGAKVDDSIGVLESLLSRGLVERVLVGGLVANVFLAAAGDPGEATAAELTDLGYAAQVETASAILDRFGDRIDLPLDVAVDRDGTRVEVDVARFPLQGSAIPRDVGAATIDRWSDLLATAGTAICNGPLGLVEDDRFAAGTRSLFEAVARAEYAIAGGGDTASALRRFDIDGVDHVSTGGGATLALLSGRTLPGVEALETCDIEPRP